MWDERVLLDVAPVTTYAYDRVGNRRLVTDAEENNAAGTGSITTFEYDNLDRQVKLIEQDPDGSGGPLDVSTTEYRFDVASQMRQVSDPLDRETTYDYDEQGRQVRTTSPADDHGENPVMQYVFDAVGNVLEEKLKVSDTFTQVTTNEYDNLNRLVKVTEADPDGAGPKASPETTFVYDIASRRTSITDPLVRTTTYDFDDGNRITKEIYPDPDGAGALASPFMTYEYDLVNNVVSEADGLLHTVTYDYDTLYRKITETDANLDVMTFVFDEVGNMESQTDAVANTTTWEFDALDRVVEEENQLGDSRLFAFDLVNNRIETTDRNGRVTQYVYDRQYRQTNEKWLDSGSTVIRDIAFTYDAADQMLTSDDADHDYSYDYDDLGRVTFSTIDVTGLTPGVTLAHDFDLAHNRTQVDATVGGTLDYSNDYVYDQLLRNTRIDQHSIPTGNGVAEKRFDFAYDVASQSDTLHRYADLAGNELVAQTQFGFDDTSRLTDLTHSKGGSNIADYDWAFDIANRVTQFVSSVDGTADYQYDARDQVTDAAYDYQTDEDYEYDENGNRKNNGFVTPNGNANRLTTDGTHNYLYDAEGNMTRRTHIANDTVTLYDWDHRNRLVDVTTYGSTADADAKTNSTKLVTHTYDAYNQWLSRTVDPDGQSGSDPIEETFFIHDDGQIVLHFDGDTAADLAHRYVWSNGIDAILADEKVTNPGSAGDVMWPLADNLGTVRDLVSYDSGTGTTTVENHITYGSFGNVIAETDVVDQLFYYTGKALDKDTGAQNNINRWYFADIGRFGSEDPIQADISTYRYGGNNPIGNTDPSGNSALGKAVKKTVKETGHAIMKRRLKAQIKKKLIQIHHMIPTSVFTKGPHAKWLKRLGVDKDSFANVTPLPTVKGIMNDVGKKRTMHDGGHLSKYFKDVNKSLDDIMTKNLSKKNPISDAQATASIRTLQDKLRKDLKEGAIELHNEADLLKKYGTGAALVFIGMSATDQEAYAEQAAEKEAQKFEAVLNKPNTFTVGRAATYTGQGDDAAGWLGWSIDMVNPFDDVGLIGDAIGVGFYYMGVDMSPPKHNTGNGGGSPKTNIGGARAGWVESAPHFTPKEGRIWRFKGGGSMRE